MILFFDTETNGVARDYNAPPSAGDNWPRMVQLAFCITTDAGDIAFRYSTLIVPDGWTIPETDFFVNNGMSTARCEHSGIDASAALLVFASAVNSCDLIVAHNIRFDYGVVASEMLRYDIRATNKPARLCTMQELTNAVSIPNPRGGFKWPKLEEAYRFLFNSEMENAHDAMGDVDALVKIFFEAKKQKLL